MTTARKIDETLNQYRVRQRLDKEKLKQASRGTLIWNSASQGAFNDGRTKWKAERKELKKQKKKERRDIKKLEKNVL